jgi:hypothetical protein
MLAKVLVLILIDDCVRVSVSVRACLCALVRCYGFVIEIIWPALLMY